MGSGLFDNNFHVFLCWQATEEGSQLRNERLFIYIAKGNSNRAALLVSLVHNSVLSWSCQKVDKAGIQNPP